MRILSLENDPGGCGQAGCTATHYTAKLFVEPAELDAPNLENVIQDLFQQRLPNGGAVRVTFAITCPGCKCDKPADLVGLLAQVNIPGAELA